MLLSRANSRRLSHTTQARIVIIGILLLLAAFSGHPVGASLSGALDKVMFDTATRVFAHPSVNRVAVVLIDDKTLTEFRTEGLTTRSSTLLRHLGQAASVTFDYSLGFDSHTAELATDIVRNGHVVLPISASIADPLAVASAGRGQRHVTVGHYGVVTGFVPYLSASQGGYPNIVLEAVRVAGAQHVLEHAHAHWRSYALSLASTRTDAVLMQLGHPQQIPQYSFADVIDGKVAADAFKDRLVFVGNAIGDDAGFRISSLNMDEVSRVQLDALMADAMLSGNMASELPGVVVPIHLAIALGMVLICIGIRGRRMHAAVLGLFVLMLLFPMLLLGVAHRWLGLGLLPLVCVLIYTYFAWERLRRTQNLLRREVDKLRTIASTVGMADTYSSASPTATRSDDPMREVRQAMREIRSLQVTFVTLINQLPYPVFVVTDGRVSVWNASASALLGSAMPGGGISLPEVQELIAQHCRGETSTSAEVMIGGREHMLFYVPYADIDTALHSESTRQHSFLVCLVDIADIKQSVTHDKQALRHIAHDLRSPLSTILQLIEERAEGQRRETPHDRAFLEDLRRQADYSLRVAKDFLQLSRAEQIRSDTFAPVALLDIATEAVDQLWPAAESKSIELIGPECELEDTLLMGNADMLIRAIVNVIDNALKYSQPQTAITVRIVDEGEEGMVLHVIDQGVGIAAEHLPHLFDPFFQADGKGDADRGVGLGLPFVKAVIERHGGDVQVHSEPGKGTDFRIVLARNSARSSI
jgi:CHASE2 domain-containing sensor protein/two-component sensor histidine kinase